LAKKSKNPGDPIVIKKYANRRLYNTDTSSYVTLDDLCKMVKASDDFVVMDAKTGEDLTHSVLTQIIFEEENKGEALLPTNFLRQLISCYGDQMQMVVPGYLEASMEAFARNQEKMKEFFEGSFQGGKTFTPQNFTEQFQEMARQNMKAFEQAMGMFTPFQPTENSDDGAGGNAAGAAGMPSPTDQIKALQQQMAMMQAQLLGLNKDKK